MTANILLINNGRILAEGNVHQIRELIDEHPHTVHIRAADPRRLAREFLKRDDVLSMRFEPGAVVVETAKPDLFYAKLTEIAAGGEHGPVDEVTSPDDNLQAVFQYRQQNVQLPVPTAHSEHYKAQAFCTARSACSILAEQICSRGPFSAAGVGCRCAAFVGRARSCHDRCRQRRDQDVPIFGMMIGCSRPLSGR